MKHPSLHLLCPPLGTAFERLKQRLARWFTQGQAPVLAPEAYHGPTLEELLAQDESTRLLILALVFGTMLLFSVIRP